MDFTYYGVDWGGPVGINEGNGQVEVPITTCPLDTAELQQLREQIDPFVDDNNYGIDTFNGTVNAVHSLKTCIFPCKRITGSTSAQKP